MSTFLICSAIGYFADDVAGTCAQCGASLVHRPHMPVGASTICIRCGAKLLNENPGARIKVTKDTRREVALYGRRTKGVQ